MIVEDRRFAMSSHGSTIPGGAMRDTRTSPKSRRAFGILERLEDRFVPTGLGLIPSIPIVAGLTSSATVLVQQVDIPAETGGSLLAVASSVVTPVVSLGLSTMPGGGIDVGGSGGLIASVLDAGTAIVDQITGESDPGEGEMSPPASPTGGGLGTGVSVSIPGVSLEIPVVASNPATGTDGSIPTVPTVPGTSSGTTATSPSSSPSPVDPPPTGGTPVSPPIAGIAGGSGSAPPIVVPNPGVPTASGVSAPPSAGSTPPGPIFVAIGPAAPSVVLGPLPVSIDVPMDVEHTGRSAAASSSEPSLPEAVSSRAQLVVTDRADAGPTRTDETSVAPGAVASVTPTQAAMTETGHEVTRMPAELFLRDLESLERALGELAARLDRVGAELAEQLIQISTLELLAATGLGCLAFEVFRRWERQKERLGASIALGSRSLPGPFYRPRVPLV